MQERARCSSGSSSASSIALTATRPAAAASRVLAVLKELQERATSIL